jgi:hypothetical protein
MINFMKNIYISLMLCSLLPLFFTGCASGPQLNDVTEKKAEQAAQYVRLQSGLIENAVAGITHIAIYSIPEGTDKQPIIDRLHIVMENLTSIIKIGETNPTEIRSAFRVNESQFDGIFLAASELVNMEVQQAKKNGYGDLSIEFLSSVAKGISDGTAK